MRCSPAAPPATPPAASAARTTELVRRLNVALQVPTLCCQAAAGLVDLCEQPVCTVLHPGDVLRRLRCLHSFHLVSSV
jgi:hypothetical protein